MRLWIWQVIANFSATWCGPCKVVAPFYSELSEKYESLMFLVVDVDELTVSSELQYHLTLLTLFAHSSKLFLDVELKLSLIFNWWYYILWGGSSGIYDIEMVEQGGLIIFVLLCLECHIPCQSVHSSMDKTLATSAIVLKEKGKEKEIPWSLLWI